MGSRLVTLGPKWCPKGSVFRGHTFNGKKVFATAGKSWQELAREIGAGWVPYKTPKNKPTELIKNNCIPIFFDLDK